MALMTVGRVDLLLGKRPEVVVLLLKQLDSVTHLATAPEAGSAPRVEFSTSDQRIALSCAVPH